MFHPRSIWLAFAVCLAVVLGAMGWVSRTVLRLERERNRARQQAVLEDNIRLALWRIDSAIAPMLAEESARPYFVYQAFYRPSETSMSPALPGRFLAPSPLLQQRPPHALLYFQLDAQGRLTSPQVPEAKWRELAIPEFISEAAVTQAEQRLNALGRAVDFSVLAPMLPEPASAPAQWVAAPLIPDMEQHQALKQRRADLNRQGRAAVEFDQRSQAVSNVNAIAQQEQQQLAIAMPESAASDLGGAPMTPLWRDGQMLLARRMHVNGSQVVQGCLLDWPAIRRSLLESVADLLPGANLVPAVPDSSNGQARRLAALPAQIVPGPIPHETAHATSALQISLLAAWGCALLAAVSVAGLLWGVVQLSERRAAFVSAVTHELRTPLTTFQMYAEMLSDGMVTEPAQQKEYLATLRRESARLIHLVENVLSYARLERGRGRRRTQRLRVGQLLERAGARLADRARQANMELQISAPDSIASEVVCTDPGAVEQILFNLVDNACKYAAAATDRRIHLDLRLQTDWFELEVRDHGPGVGGGVARRLFRPFTKSAHEAAESAPGVGLGLALSRRLARQLGGELRLDASMRDGAAFVLRLRKA